MENASKALIMAAEILLGVMILSIAVYMFKNYAEYSSSTYSEIEATQIAEFNSKFLKFQGEKVLEDDSVAPVECTIHDIVSLANLAQKHNIEHEIQDNSGYEVGTLYVQIDLGNSKRNLEKKDNNYFVNLIKDNALKEVVDPVTGETGYKTKYYECIECNINTSTGRVNYMKFKEI